MPRVISGRVGGLSLKAPDGKKTRPSADRTKEGMFSALSARLDFSGLQVLELFAGSGQLGIEALSRGAERATFVEQHRATAELIKTNLAHCGLTEQGRVLCSDAIGTAQQLAAQGQCFDLILLDPPYAEAWVEFAKLEKLLQASGLLQKDGYVVLESDAKAPNKGNAAYLQHEKSCQYGTAMVSFYRHPDTGIGR